MTQHKRGVKLVKNPRKDGRRWMPYRINDDTGHMIMCVLGIGGKGGGYTIDHPDFDQNEIYESPWEAAAADDERFGKRGGQA